MCKIIYIYEIKNVMNALNRPFGRMMNRFDVDHSLLSTEVESFDSVRAKEEKDFEAELVAWHMEVQQFVEKAANALSEMPATDAKTEQHKKDLEQLIHKVRVLSQLYLNLAP